MSDFDPDSEYLKFATARYDSALAAGFDDDNAALPIPVKVRQNVYHGDMDFIILDYTVTYDQPEHLDHLSIGFFADFDLSSDSDLIGFDSVINMPYQYNPEANLYIGVVGLSNNEFSFKLGLNGDTLLVVDPEYDEPEGCYTDFEENKITKTDYDSIQKEINACYEWHEKNGSLDNQVG